MSELPPTPGFAVAGQPILASRSAPLFRALCLRLGLRADYTRLSVPEARQLLPLCAELGLGGLNVTSPHKQALLPWLAQLEPAALRVGAVNTIIREGDAWFGDNTDVAGVRQTLELHGVSPTGTRVLVLGAGGAARAVLCALAEAGFEQVRLCNRSLERAQTLARALPVPVVGLPRLEAELADCDLLISCVPGDPGLVPAAWLHPGMTVFDADYRARGLARAAALAGCRIIPGSDWLALQAVASFERFLNTPLDAETRAWLRCQAAEPLPLPDGPVVLAGFSGTGKSTVGAILSRILGWAYVDTDDELRWHFQADIPTIFATHGEEAFRAREREVVQRALSLPRTVVALGGGALLDPESRAQLDETGLCVLLHAPLQCCMARVRKDAGRPLLGAGSDPQALLAQRMPGYLACADLCLSSHDASPQALAAQLATELGAAGLLEASRVSVKPLTLHPGVLGGASLRPPPSKSHGIRALAAASLSDGVSRLHSPPRCEDFRVAMEICHQLGASVMQRAGHLEIHGTCGRRPPHRGNGPVVLDCGESALCLRLFACIAAALGGSFTLKARGSLRRRSITGLEDALRDLGVRCSSDGGFPPLNVEGPPTRDRILLDASGSSQVLSGLLMAAAVLPRPTSIQTRDLVSLPYAELTLAVLRDFGVSVQASRSLDRFELPGAQRIQPRELTVSADWSAVAFLLVAGATTGEVLLRGVDPCCAQGDKLVLQVLQDAGAHVETAGDTVLVARRPLIAFEFEGVHHPDLFPPLAVLAAACEGRSILRGVSRLRNKESDRAEALTQLLTAMGIDIRVEGDSMLITGGPLHAAALDAHGDHRIAMAAAVAALRADGPCTLWGAEHVAKSYPRFFHDLDTLCGGAP